MKKIIVLISLLLLLFSPAPARAIGWTPTARSNVSAGDVVVIDADNDNSVETTTTQGASKVGGIAAETVASGNDVEVDTEGMYILVNVTTATRGQYLVTSTTAGKAVGVAAVTAGVFGVAMTSASAGQCRAFVNTGLTSEGTIAEADIDTEAELETLLTDVSNVIVSTEIDSEAELEALMGAINIIVSTEIDSISELETLLGAVNVILATEIDSVSELETIMGAVNLIEATEIDSLTELEALMGAINIIAATEIDSESELENIVGVDFALANHGHVTLQDTFTNGSGANLTANTAVLIKEGSADTFDDDWALGATNFLGVLAEAIDNAASGLVNIAGIVTIDGIYTPGFDEGDYLAFGPSGTGHTTTRDDTCWGIITEVIDADSCKALITHPIHTGGTGGGGGAGGAPTDATYITQTANGDLSAEQALSSLDDGILKHASGVVAKAVSGTDYLAPGAFVNRGDPAAVDFAVGDLTTDATYRDLDLSAIVPAGAKAVVLRVGINDDVAGSAVIFRRNGNTNTIVNANLNTQVANLGIAATMIVACDENRVIEYWATSTTWTAIAITVAGWFL